MIGRSTSSALVLTGAVVNTKRKDKDNKTGVFISNFPSSQWQLFL